MDGLVQDCGISIADAIEIPQYCTEPTISKSFQHFQCNKPVLYFDGLEEDCSISNADILKISLSSTKPLIWPGPVKIGLSDIRHDMNQMQIVEINPLHAE